MSLEMLELRLEDFFAGYTWISFGLIAIYISMGFIMGRIMRYFSNIHKLLMQGVSMYISVALVIVFLDVSYDWHFWAGLGLISASILLYNWEMVIGGSKKVKAAGASGVEMTNKKKQ